MATTKRWKRYGQDRVYVTAADGTALGFLNLLTGQPERVRLDRAAEFYSALAAWRRHNPAPPPDAEPEITPTLGPPPPTEPRVSHPPLGPTAAPIGPAPQPLPPPPPTVTRHNRYTAGQEPDQGWVDLAANAPGQAAADVAAAYRQASPITSRLARLFRLRTTERAWRIGAAGEVETAKRLRPLTDGGGWRVLHSVPVGGRGTDIDHVLIGPGGIYTINTKNHPKALVWAGPETISVNRHPTPYAGKARAEADRAARLLSVAVGLQIPVTPVIVVVGGAVGGDHQPKGVTVVPVKKLAKWLRHQPPLLRPGTVEKLYAIARRSTTWQH